MNAKLLGLASAMVAVLAAGAARADTTVSLTNVTAVDSVDGSGNHVKTYDTVLNLLAGTYSFNVVWNPASAFISSWTLTAGSFLSQAGGSIAGSTLNTSLSAPFSVSTAGLYHFVLTSSSSSSTVGTFSTATVTGNFSAVPGPIAGAGIPMVAAAFGAAAWRRRRMKAA